MERYLRQIGIPQIGEAGQARLLSSSVLVIGAGGLGSALLYCLAAAGTGHITVADYDVVQLSNLNRQFLHSTDDIGRKKAVCAAEKLRALNPEIQICTITDRVEPENAGSIVAGYDVVLTALDNLSTRLAVNKACIEANIPLINGGISGMSGSMQIVEPFTSACLACLYGNANGEGEIPEGSETAVAPVVTCVSSLMAQAALLLLLGQKNLSDIGLLYFDGLQMSTEHIKLERNGNCPHCGLLRRG